MPFKRITPEEIAALGVVAAPDKLTGKAEENKAIFDRLVRELVAATYNGLLDALEAPAGAAELGAEPFPNVASATVQGQLRDVQANHEALREQGGAAYVGAEPFGGLAGETVQRQMEETHEMLHGEGGAAYIGAAPFNGVPAKTVQGQLRDIQQNVEDINDGIIPQQSVTMEKLGLDVLEQLEAPPTPHFSTELDDYTAEIGRLTNAGAGWNTYRFRTPFQGVPVVMVQPAVEFSGWVEVKQVTETGFLYCLRRSKLTPGTATTAPVYVGNGSGTSPAHSAKTVVTAVTQASLVSETVSDKVELAYIALEYGGGE